MRHFAVKNFEKFQHYKDRRPPWIKLYTELLDDYEFCHLPDDAKWHLVAIWLLASRYDNRVPYDAEWIARKISASLAPKLELLEAAGFIKQINDEGNASAVLATGRQVAIPETETETETETDISSLREEGGSKLPPCPHGEIVNLYHKNLPELPTVREWNKTRRGYLQARWKEHPDLAYWDRLFKYISKSDFLMGRTEGTKGKPPFLADLEWIVRPTNFAKIIEGKYHRKAA